MFRFTICALCALVCAPAFADPIIISSGPLPSLIEEHSVIVAGEYVKNLRSSATVEISGGHFIQTLRDGFGLKRLTAPTFIIHARYARSRDISGNEGGNPGDALIEGWLDDGQWFRFVSINEDDAPGFTMLHVTPSDEPLPFLLDADDDSDIDLEDLNIVRNNFGSSGEGDIDGNGSVDIGDLNHVRNNFGTSQFQLGESFEAPAGWSYAGQQGTFAVPEPSSIALVLLGITALCSRCRLRS